MSATVSGNSDLKNQFGLVARMVKNFESNQDASIYHNKITISCDTTKISRVSRAVSLYESGSVSDSFGNFDKGFGHESTHKKTYFKPVKLSSDPIDDRLPRRGKQMRAQFKFSTRASDETQNMSENLVSSETETDKQGCCVRFEETVKVIDEDGFVFEELLMTQQRSEMQRNCKLSMDHLPDDLLFSSRLHSDSDSMIQGQLYYFDGVETYALDSNRIEFSSCDHYVIVIEQSVITKFRRKIGSNTYASENA